ncbi:MAG TPA: serine/threonine-protein kinase [Ktedonobacteraceae bacterium]
MQQDPLIGTMLGKYKVLAILGQGGMARVYRARQENLDREVAVKVLPPWYAADRSFVDRFEQEAKLVARLSHPNIVTVHDASQENGHLYIVMQLVDGGTFKNLLDNLRNSPGTNGAFMDLLEANRIFQQLASALAYAHENGIVHRDIKPVNVLMDRAGRPVLSDFGIAKALVENNKVLTRPGAGVGTPEYMSPEQCMGGQVDGRADIYALGIMLYEALTGRTPFLGDNYHAIAHSHIYEIPSDVGVFNPSIPLPVRDVIMTALQKRPEMRYQLASQMANALELAVNGMYQQASLPRTDGFIDRLPTRPISPSDYAARASGLSNQQSLSDSDSGAYSAQTVLKKFPCPTCQSLNKPGMNFCTRCGSYMNPCPNCHHANRARDRFCTRCGQHL